MKKVLFLDDNLERHTAFKEKFKYPDTNVVYIETVNQAIKELDSTIYDVAFLDHDLGGKIFVKEVEGTGYEVALYIKKMPPEKRPYQVILHSHNPAGAIRMYNALIGEVKKVQIIPFSALIQLI